jgi:hypothetical protein
MKREKEGNKEVREESETVNRDSYIPFSPHRFGRLACCIMICTNEVQSSVVFAQSFRKINGYFGTDSVCD